MVDLRNNQLKIGFLIPSLNVGGSERVMSMLASILSDMPRIQIDIIAFGPDRKIFYALNSKVTVRQPSFDFNHERRTLSTLRTLQFVRRTVKVGAYDMLLSFGERWNNFVMVACIGLGVKTILSDQSSPEIDLGPLQSRLRRLLYPRAAGLIAQTNAARNMALQAQLHDRIVVIPNPVIAPPPQPERDRQNIVLTVGRLIATKHHDRLIRIFSSLDGKDWQLVIVGDDSQRQEHRARLVEIAGRLGVADRVRLVGSQADVQQFYDRAKVFAFTSSSEGLPNVVAEALASGLPVVSYDCVAGPSDLVVDGVNGYLTDVFDDIAFAERLDQLMSNNKRRREMSEAARDSILHLAPERISEDFLQAMRHLAR